MRTWSARLPACPVLFVRHMGYAPQLLLPNPLGIDSPPAVSPQRSPITKN